MPENPYLPDKGQQLAMLLMSLGGGISQAASSGQGGFAGVGPGIANFANSLGAAQQQREADALRRWQIGLQEREIKAKEDERRRIGEAAAGWTPPGMSAPGTGVPSVPGMTPPPSRPRMGPDTYDTRTAGLEGGTRNGGMVFNELGSGAYGPYQFMPATWADVRANNPDLNLPADITQASREQHDAAHERFKAGNARALQSAGFEPTPQNLYLAHRFGVGGATSLLRSGDDKMLADVLPIDWQRQNPDMRGQTVGGFKRLAGERMQGVGVPYQAGGETTSYALQPSALPAFAGMPGVTDRSPRALPVGQVPDFTAPVMPQPVGPQMQPPQGGPTLPPSPNRATGSMVAQGSGDGSVVPAPPPSPPIVPRPGLPPEDAARLKALVNNRTLTPQQGEQEAHRIVNELWKVQQDQANKVWQQQNENYRFDRGEAAKNEQWYTLGPDDVKMFPGLDPSKAYQRNKKTGEVKPIGAPMVNIDQKGETEFAKEVGKNDAKRLNQIQENTNTVLDTVAKIRAATNLLGQTYTGPGAEYANAFYRTLGSLGVDSAKDKADAATAATALIAELTPRMRVPGSGATSDFEMQTFGKSLVSLMNTPGGNEKIAQYWERIAERQVAIQSIAERYATENKGLTGTKFAEEVKALGPLFSKDELEEMKAAGKTKPPAERPPLATFGGNSQNMTPMPNQRPPLDSFGGRR